MVMRALIRMMDERPTIFTSLVIGGVGFFMPFVVPPVRHALGSHPRMVSRHPPSPTRPYAAFLSWRDGDHFALCGLVRCLVLAVGCWAVLSRRAHQGQRVTTSQWVSVAGFA